MATLKSATDVLSAKIAAAAEGGKTAVAERNHQKEVVVKLLEQLAHYAEANCKEDMTIFLSFGFTPKASAKKKTPPASESFRKVEPGPNSGEMKLTLMPFPDAASYLVQYAELVKGLPGSWTSKPVASTRPPVLITGLTPGATYVFQARAVTKTGYSDWSESVTRIAV
jgi:Fibronectin type III domain